MRNGCYAEGGNVAFTTRRLNAAADAMGATADDVARAEADAIDQGAVIPGLPLRLHVVGDATSPERARIVASAAERRERRGGGRAWTYTHAWKAVHRMFWGRVSVLASAESVDDIPAMRAAGYAPAVVVREHAAGGKAWKASNGTTLIPCPQQTRGTKCTDCGLCLDADALYRRNAGIAFAAHGTKVAAVRARLPVLQ
jgi:hypothetical protein